MTAGSDPQLSEYLTEWLDRRRVELRPSTLVGYRHVVRSYLAPTLGANRLSELDRRNIETAYAQLLESGGRGGRSLSPRTVRQAHAVLRRALHDAVLDGLLETNPAGTARCPKRDPQETEAGEDLKVWTAEEASRFLQFVDDHEWRALWHLALGTGARRGELLGLLWSDVNLTAGEIRIRRALSVIDGVPRLLGTKTSSTRTLSIGRSVVGALHVHRQAQRAERSDDAPSSMWDLVMTDSEGGHIDPMAVTLEFRRLVRRAPVPVIRLHDLRHTHATLLLSEGVPVTVVSERLGHAKTSMTLDVYGHVLPALDSEAADRFERVLSGARFAPGAATSAGS